MAVSRYWRVVGLQVPDGADLVLSRLHLVGAGGRVDLSATVHASLAPVAGDVSAITDTDDLSVCRFAARDVHAAGFALTWVLDAAARVTALEIRSPSLGSAPALMTLLSSVDGAAWETEASAVRTMPTYAGELVSVETSSASGQLIASAAAYSGRSTTPPQTYNVNATSEPTWGANYADTATIGAFTYASRTSAPATTPKVTKAMDFVIGSSGVVLSVTTGNGSYTNDYGHIDLEFLVGTSVVAAVAVRRVGNFQSGLFYGPNLAALTEASRYGAYPQANGRLDITQAQIKYTPAESAANTFAFTYTRDLSQVTALRLTVEAVANGPVNGAATALLRLMSGLNTGGQSRPLPVATGLLHGLVAASTGVAAFQALGPSCAATARDVEFGGAGTIYGTTKTKGTPNLPTKARVRLLRDRDALLARETWSDPATGAFDFPGIDTNQKFTTLAADANDDFRPVAAGQITPEVMP